MRSVALFIGPVLIAALVSCSNSPPPVGTPPGKAVSAGRKAPLILSAAASTKDVMESLAAQFYGRMSVEVIVNVGPSSGLANQILTGAPADLFLSANQEWADAVDKAGLAQATCRLLTNRLVLVVPADNPARVQQPGDLLSNKVKRVALAGENVPAGSYAQQALSKLGLYDELSESGKIARGQDVRVTLSYVERGEAEAGIIYATDVAVAANVKEVYAFDPSLHDKVVYELVLVKRPDLNPAARQLYDFLQSTHAMEIFEKYGFTQITTGD